MMDTSESMDISEPPPEQVLDSGTASFSKLNDGTDEAASRLMISKMVLENFKSYAGVKEIGPFHKCFSSVVGPNGSGKSNVIDAMLFVFGKRAKKLRLNKVSELIHKSDAVKNEPPQFARVSVHFQEIIDTGDGDEDFQVISGTETIVSRIAKKDNSSTYKLNGKNSSFKDIGSYLERRGIDLDNNRFLILQGEVEMISMMPPKGKSENDEGLLEYLEDIIGSSKFVEATNEAERKVEELTEARQEKLNRVKAVEKEKDNLEGAKQEAESLLAKEREIRHHQNILLQVNAMKLEKEYLKLSEEKANVSKNLNSEREALASSEKKIQVIEDGLTEQKRDYEVTFNELKRTKEEFSAFERKDIKLREEIKHERAQIKKLEEKNKEEEKKKLQALKKKELAESRIPKLEEEIKTLMQTKEREQIKLDKMEDEAKVATQEIRILLEAKTHELGPVKQERSVMQADLETAETELKIFVDSIEKAKERLKCAEDELSTIDETKKEKQKQLELMIQKSQGLEESIAKFEAEDAELEIAEVALDKRHEDLVNQLEDTKSLLRSGGGKTRSKAVQGILQAARRGGELEKVGILGRLGDLATIPEAYDVAISTACGGMLDNIVVQTTAGAQRCLEFLRKYNLGRASFIPLDKQKKGAHDRHVETPEGAPRLFDLIVPQNFAVTPALFLAVGNTLVAPDMDTASRWAYESSKRWRVVTVSGNLIETTGTMSGGGKTARSGGMRIANSRKARKTIAPDEDPETLLEKLRGEVDQAEGLLKECRTRRLEIKSELRSSLKLIRSAKASIPKFHLEINGCDTTRQELTKLIPDLKKECLLSQKDATKRAEIERKVVLCKESMSSCVEKAKALEAEVSALQKEIFDAGGQPLKKQKKLCEKIRNDLKDANKSLTSSKLAISSSEKAVIKTTECISDVEGKLLLLTNSLESKESEFKSLESGALAVMTAFEKVKSLEAEKRGALEIASKEIDALKASLSKIRCMEVELVGNLEQLEKQLTDNRKKANQLEKDILKISNCRDELAFEGDEEDQSTILTLEKDLTEIKDVSRLPVLSLEKYDVNEIKDVIATLQSEKNTLAKNANMGAIAEYRKKEADYLQRVGELDKVTEERNSVRKEHEELRRQRLEMFMDGFGTITLKLKEMYQMITLGGDAELELVDSLDPFSEGIVFSVRPPKKSWKNISNLSGGEKTLSSLSLVFALHHYKPTPLYVMDEIDAALDFKNVSIVANYIKERTKNAQFIIISLRNNMFELADRLVGIYKTNNCTKSVTINPRAFGRSAKKADGALLDSTNNSSSSKMMFSTAAGDAKKIAEQNDIQPTGNETY